MKKKGKEKLEHQRKGGENNRKESILLTITVRRGIYSMTFFPRSLSLSPFPFSFFRYFFLVLLSHKLGDS